MMDLQMLGEIGDALRKDRDLNLGRAGVGSCRRFFSMTAVF